MGRGMLAARTLLVLLAAAGTVVACDSREDVSFSSRPVAPEGWRSHDTLTFETDTIPRDADYGLEVSLRTTDAYPYKTIWISVTREFAHPDARRTDTVECPVVDPATLRRGKGVHLSTSSVRLAPMRLSKGQTGRIRLTHLMLREKLPGVHDAGIRLYRRP